MPTASAWQLPATAQRASLRDEAPKAAILAISSHLPEKVLDNAQLEAMVDTSDTWILERTGIRERRQVGAGETVSMMGAEAARAALAQAGNPVPDLIICATCTPDTLLPSAACLIQRRLGLPAGIAAFDLNAACSGYVYGLCVAGALISSGTCKTILLVSSEALTTLVDYGDRATCVLFGDGAAATVLGASSSGGIVATNWGADGAHGELIYYGPRPGASDGDGHRGGADDALRMAGKGTFRLAVERLCEVSEKLCEEAGWTAADIDHFVPHQANQRIIEASAKRLGVPLEKVVVNVAERGNTSAASIPIALAEADATGRFRPGDRIVAAAFGAGATWGGVALQWTAERQG
jgi:3-oxoacyl-[acyl-carrier-protein] synthase-3